MRFLFILFFLFSSYTSIYSQKLSAPQHMDWSIQNGSTVSQQMMNHKPFSNKILRLKENEIVAAVELKTKSWGIIKINDGGMTKWKSPIKGITLGLGKMEGDLIAFYADEKIWPKKVTAVLLDEHTGKIKNEKVIYESTEPHAFDINVLNKPSGDFDRLIIRLTEYKTKNAVIGGNTLLLFKTKKITELKVNKDLTTDAKSNFQVEALKNDFIGCLVDNDSNLFFISQSGKDVIVEKLDVNGIRTAKLSTNIGYPSDALLNVFFKLDENNFNNVLVGIHCRFKNPANKIFKFDINSGSVYESPVDNLNKSYARSLDLLNIPSVMDAGFQDIETLEIREILSFPNVYVVVKEIDGGIDSYGARSDHLVISFYTKS
jgi:hypothetical protein